MGSFLAPKVVEEITETAPQSTRSFRVTSIQLDWATQAISTVTAGAQNDRAGDRFGESHYCMKMLQPPVVGLAAHSEK